MGVFHWLATRRGLQGWVGLGAGSSVRLPARGWNQAPPAAAQTGAWELTTAAVPTTEIGNTGQH